MSYDAWKTTEPDDRDPAPPMPWRCLDCPKKGKTGLAAYDHHREDHHRIALPGGLLSVFSCCPHEPERDDWDELYERQAARYDGIGKDWR